MNYEEWSKLIIDDDEIPFWLYFGTKENYEEELAKDINDEA